MRLHPAQIYVLVSVYIQTVQCDCTLLKSTFLFQFTYRLYNATAPCSSLCSCFSLHTDCTMWLHPAQVYVLVSVYIQTVQCDCTLLKSMFLFQFTHRLYNATAPCSSLCSCFHLNTDCTMRLHPAQVYILASVYIQTVQCDCTLLKSMFFFQFTHRLYNATAPCSNLCSCFCLHTDCTMWLHPAQVYVLVSI